MSAEQRPYKATDRGMRNFGLCMFLGNDRRISEIRASEENLELEKKPFVQHSLATSTLFWRSNGTNDFKSITLIMELEPMIIRDFCSFHVSTVGQ